MKLKLLVCGFLIASAICPRVQAQSDDLTSRLETILKEESLTGVAWTLLDESGVTYPGVLGYRDAETRSPFTQDTRFHVGSVTKSLLATGILRLATQGMIDLDAPATSYLPDLSFNNPWDKEAPVTVRHLLDHTAGLNDAHMWQMFSERPLADTPLIEGFPEPDVQLRIRAKPGTRFSYSNMGYALLGMVIESVSGERYETYLDENLLAPLGMNQSTFAFTTQEGESADPTLAWGHVDDGSRYGARAIFLRPAGQFTTTVSDLASFSRFLLSDGRINGVPFVREQWMRERGVPTTTEAAAGGLLAGYALGLGRRDRHGVVGICHAGNIVGFYAMLCVFPDEERAFAFSVNTDSETADYGRITETLIRALGVTPAAEPLTVAPPSGHDSWHGRYILSPNRFQTFEYLDSVFGAIRVTPGGDEIEISSLQQNPVTLRPVGGALYSASNRTTASHVLAQSVDGSYVVSDGFRTFEKVSSAWLFAHWASVLLGILGLTWLWAAGVISLVRNPKTLMQKAEAPTFLAIMALMIPVPFFLSQSFMALGDFTLASGLLALVTLLLPIGVFFSLVRSLGRRHQSGINRLHAVAAFCAFQWCLVLMFANMLPLRLWA